MVKKWCQLTSSAQGSSGVKTTKEIGGKAERFAQQYIRKQGLKVLATNVGYPFGEIDLIAEDGNELVFIEVRFRSGRSHGTAVETVQRSKQRRIALASQAWLAGNRAYQNHYCRFDLIAIDSVIDSKHTNWEKNAFQTPGYQ